MHVGPSADADGIDALVFEEFLPTAIDGGDVELVGDGPARLDGAVGDGDDLAVLRCLEAGDVAVSHVASGANEPHPDLLVGHLFLPFFHCLRLDHPG